MKLSQYQPQLTADFVAQALHLTILNLPEVEFSAVTTDSRKVEPGHLFVAIKGEKMDGNDFLEAAVNAGASGILCRRGVQVPIRRGLAVFHVEDTLIAYRKLAAKWRREFSIPVVAVAGSAGKTTTKELLTAILQGRWKEVLKTQGSQNGFLGIPMTLMELNSKHQAAVIEVGIDEIGAMAEHMNVVAPTAAVLTAIGPEHLEKLIDVPTVAHEEGIALSHVSKNHGLVAISLDDPWIRPHSTILKEGRAIGFSLEHHKNPGSQGELIQGTLSADHRELILQGVGLDGLSLKLPLLGKHNASNLLAAVTIAAGLGLTRDEILKGLAQFKGAEGRSEVRALPGGTQVICDYYNSQPASVQAGLELLRDLSHAQPSRPSTRWVCLGDMLELGENEESFHRGIAPQLVQLKIEHVLLYGPRMKALLDELKKLKFAGRAEHFESHADLAQALTQGVKPGDCLLIKGSRGMKMEEVWKVFQTYASSHGSHTHESQDRSTDP